MAKSIIPYTILLITITLLSKVIGFFREVTLLESVGFSSDLDIFLVLFSLSTVVNGMIGASIMTNLTPIAHERSAPEQIMDIMIEGMKVGVTLAALTMALSFVYLTMISEIVDDMETAMQLARIIPLTVIFAILAEYQVAILLAHNKQLPVISGNIMISVPTILLLLFSDVGVVGYAWGLMLSFLLRTTVFSVLIIKSPRSDYSYLKALKRPTILRNQFLRIAAGGSAMNAIHIIVLGCMLAAQSFSTGNSAFIAYGYKIPMLVLTSVWFVIGSRFFSRLVAEKARNARKQITQLTILNLLIAVFVSVFVIMAQSINWQELGLGSLEQSEFFKVFSASAPFLPIIVFVPIIEMTQRTLVTLKRHYEVFVIALSIVFIGAIGITASFFLASPSALVFTISGATLAGALVSVIILIVARPRPEFEE